MKYFPLVWAAVMRKPARAILTLLSVMLAFTLFGLTIGMNATFAKLKEEARDDRIFAGARFGGMLPVGMARQIESIPGVAMVAHSNNHLRMAWAPSGLVRSITFADGRIRLRPREVRRESTR